MKNNFWIWSKKFVYQYGIWLILLLAGFLRTFKLHSQNVFYGTTSELYRDLSVEYDMLVRGKIVLLGPFSSLGGFSFGAIYYYLMAPFAWFFDFNPAGVVLMSTFYSLLALLVFYKLIQLWFKSQKLALLGAFLLAISTFDIQFDYYVSNPNPQPFFVLAFFYCLTLWLENRRKRWPVVGMALALGVATQLHATALLILPLSLIAILFKSRKWVPIKEALLFLAVSSITYLPYFIYEFTHRFENLRRIFVLGGSNFSPLIKAKSLYSVAEFFSSSFIFKNGYFDLMNFSRTWYIILLAAASLVIVAGWLAYRKNKGSTAPAISPAGKIIAGTWSLASLLVFVTYQKDIAPFYFLIMWPLPILLFAWSIIWIGKKNLFVGISVVLVFLLAQGVCLSYFYSNIDDQAYNHKELLKSFQSLTLDAQGKSFNVIDGSDSKNLFLFYMRLSGLADQTTRHNADILYYIYNNDSQETLQAISQRYIKESEFKNSRLRVVKMVRR